MLRAFSEEADLAWLQLCQICVLGPCAPVHQERMGTLVAVMEIRQQYGCTVVKFPDESLVGIPALMKQMSGY